MYHSVGFTGLDKWVRNADKDKKWKQNRHLKLFTTKYLYEHQVQPLSSASHFMDVQGSNQHTDQPRAINTCLSFDQGGKPKAHAGRARGKSYM